MLRLPSIFLASTSPRRRHILESIGILFQVIAPKAAEEFPTAKAANDVVVQNAKNKALSVSPNETDKNYVICGADTLVKLGNEILGKPQNKADAREMLKKLSGQSQEVITGIFLVSPNFGSREILVKSAVEFRDLSSSEIEEYLLTREPYDKAGAYAVQGVGSLFVKDIRGSYTNVMGLPVEAFLTNLADLTGTSPFQWFR